MKKYLVVCWDNYYPDGGLENIKNTFDSLHEAQDYYFQVYKDWSHAQVIDRDTLHVILEKS